VQIKLDDDEIRKILAQAIEVKTDYKFSPDPDSCWFEASAGEIDGSDITDIHSVKFCYDSSKE
jgi:hypothetical protein